MDRKSKLYDKTVKKAMDFARDEGEASGHARYNMSRLGREKDKLAAKRRETNEDINPFVQSSLEALGSIVKKNSNLGEEGYDHLRDRGMVRPSKDKKDGTSYPPSAEMKKTQKVNTGPSAAEIVKKKYGKAVMNLSKK